MTALHRITTSILRHVPEPERSERLRDVEVIRAGLETVSELLGLSDDERDQAVLDLAMRHPDGLVPEENP